MNRGPDLLLYVYARVEVLKWKNEKLHNDVLLYTRRATLTRCATREKRNSEKVHALKMVERGGREKKE